MNYPRDCSVLVWMVWMNLWQPPMGSKWIICTTSADQRCSSFNANSKKAVTDLKQSYEWATIVLSNWAWTGISLFISQTSYKHEWHCSNRTIFHSKCVCRRCPNQGCNKIILVPQLAASSLGEETQQIRCSDIVACVIVTKHLTVTGETNRILV